jgi:hypothetical protein
MSIEHDALEMVLKKLAQSHRELEETIVGPKPEPPADVEVRESKPRSKWLDLANSICHDPYRRRK